MPGGTLCLVARLSLLALVLGIVDPNPTEMRLAWKYPGCDHLAGDTQRRVDWPNLRQAVHERPYPECMHEVFDALSRLQNIGAWVDEEAQACLMGVPTLFFYLTKHSYDQLETPADTDDLRRVAFQYSVFENYISTLHPGLVDAANWTLTERKVRDLRRSVLRVNRELERHEASVAAQKRVEQGMLPIAETDIRVYVYSEEEVRELEPLLQSVIYCSRGQWGMDVQIHDFFSASNCQTDDPSEADFFFVPGYAICLLEGNIYTYDELDELYAAAVTALPYFNVSGGRDHIFSFGSGMAQNVWQSWQKYIPHSIVLTPETELFNDLVWISEPAFQTWKDIVIPGGLDLSEVISLTSHSKPLAARQHLASFYGRADKDRGAHPWVGGVDVRQDLVRLTDTPGMGDGPGGDLNFYFGKDASHDVMHVAYGSARFCFCPRGKSGWSLRLFEALFAGCVPVMLSDKWELPFEDFLDVTQFIIKWPSTRVDQDLIAYLRSLPDSVVQTYMDEGRKAMCWYFYPPKKIDVRGSLRQTHQICPAENGQDAFRGVLRLLSKKKKYSRSASRSFYFRDASGRLQRVDSDFKPLLPTGVLMLAR